MLFLGKLSDKRSNRPPEDCKLLDPATESPGTGSYLAIDTEFVALQQEEIEIKADGDREVVRPTRLGLARVSVLRGAVKMRGYLSSTITSP